MQCLKMNLKDKWVILLKKLSNENFVNRAKPEAVEKERRIKEELENKIAKFKESMNLYK